jgi:poly(A) polymerase
MATASAPHGIVRSSLAELLRPGTPLAKLSGSFRAASKQLYVVGGTVRDARLGRPHEDVDLATDATPEEVTAVVEPLAEQMWLQGVRFGTVGLQLEGVRFEITTFRTETYAPSSRHPQVAFAEDIVGDLSRRDFTINAMAVRLPDLAMLDPFNGLEDLERGLIRSPLDPRTSFTDDPLRMLRAFRFASQLGFNIEAKTLDGVRALNQEITTVSAERIRDELNRLLVGAAPGRALDQAEGVGLTPLFLPELSALKLEQDPVQRHKDVFHHTLAVVERTSPELILRLAALLHDIGKPKTRRITSEGVSFHFHEVVGADMAARRLKALRYPNEMVKKVSEIIRLHHRFHTYRLGWNDSAVRRYVRDAGPLLPTLNALVRADCTTRNRAKATRLADRMDELERRIAELAAQEELGRIRPELDGRQIMAFLGVEPGPVVGDARAFLLELRLDEGAVGQDEAYRRLDHWARSRGIEPTGVTTGEMPESGGDATED